jgi:predicted ribosome quality control (RQC) complex YloA/Tae2 family protein
VNANITTFIAGISTAPVMGTPVVVAGNGQLGVAPSSARFKDEIKPMDQASEAVLALKPVTFHYKSDKSGTPQFGLIAEEVAQVNPDLVVRDENGEIYTVRYDAVNAMLLNEFVKEHGKVEKLEAAVAHQRKDFQSTIAQQQKSFQSKLTEQEKQIETLALSLQKVSAQIEIGKPAPRVTLNNP